MHELSVVEGVLKELELQRRVHGFRRVKSVELVYGAYSCISEENLKFCFEAAARAPHLRGARLKIIRLAARFRCAQCGAGADAPREKCAACGSEEVMPLIDHAVHIRALEVA